MSTVIPGSSLNDRLLAFGRRGQRLDRRDHDPRSPPPRLRRRHGGRGELYYFPLARTVMGGLISSTFLTLLVLPYVNLGVEGAAEWMKRVWRASGPAVPLLPADGRAVGERAM